MTSVTRRIFYSVVMSFFVFLFLLVFRPFGLGSEPNALFFCAGFGITCFLVMIVLNVIVIPLLPGFFDENNWFVWKEMVWVIINVSAVGLANAMYTAWFMNLNFDLTLVGTFQFYTVAVALLPIIISVLTKYSVLRTKYERYSDALSNDVKTQHLLENQEIHPVIISSSNGKLELDTHRFLFAKSSDNYLEVMYMDGDTLKRDLLRKTLKSTAEELEKIPDIFQVHRSYIVNLDRVSRFSGNAQGLKLHFEEVETVVPVSRNLTESLRNRLAVRH